MGAASTIPSTSSASTERIDSSWYLIDRTDEIAREEAIEALLNSGELTPELVLQLAQSRLDDLDEQIQDIMTAMAATTEDARAASARLTDLRALLTAVEPALNGDGDLVLGRDRRAVEIAGGGDVEENFEQFVRSEVAAGRLTQEGADVILADLDGSDGRDGLDDLYDRINGEDGEAMRDITRRFVEAGFAERGTDNLIPGAVRMTPLTVDRYLSDAVASGRITEEERAAIVAGGRDAINNLISDANDQLRDINSQNEMMMIKLQSAMQNRTTILTSTTNLLKAMDEGNDAIVANLR